MASDDWLGVSLEKWQYWRRRASRFQSNAKQPGRRNQRGKMRNGADLRKYMNHEPRPQHIR